MKTPAKRPHSPAYPSCRPDRRMMKPSAIRQRRCHHQTRLIAARIAMQAAKPRARARSSMQVDTGAGQAPPSKSDRRIPSQSPAKDSRRVKGAQATGQGPPLLGCPKAPEGQIPGLAWHSVQREAIPGPARCGPPAMTGRRAKLR